MNKRIFPDWKSFEYKYRGREQDAFEDLARALFRKEMGIRYGLFQRINHKGNETDVIEKDNKVGGFQAKFFDNRIDADNIISSMRNAKESHPKQTHYYIYCNHAFGNPHRRKGTKKSDPIPDQTLVEEKITKVADELGLTIVWKMDRAILDEVNEESWINDVFFSVEGRLEALIEEERQHTEIAFNSINYACSFNNRSIHIDRSDILSQVENANPSTLYVIHGDGGCGKTAILHELFDKKGDMYPICYRKASSLNVKNLAAVFHLGDLYTFPDFKEAYKDCERKYFIIDSAEHLDEIEDGTILPSLVRGLMEAHWCIVFTVRNVFLSDLLNLLKYEFHQVQINKIDVGILPENQLRIIARINGIQLPADRILFDRIRNLFYFDLYTQYYAEIDHQYSDRDFLKLVWDKKIRGKNNRIGYLRESLFESFIEDRIKANSFFLPATKYINEEFDTLISEEIIADDPGLGLFITHDIFEEWGLYRIIDKKWEDKDSIQGFLTALGDTRAVRRAFRLWLKDKVIVSPDSIQSLTQASFLSDIPGIWKEEVLCAILLSDKAQLYLSPYEHQILNNTDGLAEKVIWSLRVGCLYVTDVISYKDYYLPRYAPIGSGWEYIIDLLFKHQDEAKLSIWLPALNDWVKGNSRGETTRKIGLMVIAYYKSEAYQKEYYWDRNSKTIHEILNNTVWEIKEELSELLYSRKGYDERRNGLIEFVLKETFGAMNIHLAIPQTVADLCIYYWRERPDEEDRYQYRSRSMETGYGLDIYVDMLKYFPSGANQTPTTTLLAANETIAIDFIIRLMNKCVKSYSESGYDILEKVEITDGEDKKNWQWHSFGLWCMYRGTGSPVAPYCLQSVHMALEQYLLKKSKSGEFERCEAVMQRLLFECHSSSVSAVVGSVVLAYPNEYWRIALILFRTIEFIQIDSHRALRENEAKTLYQISGDLNPNVLKERLETCKQEFRKIHLENICLNYQFVGTKCLSNKDNEKLIQTLYGILDIHRKLLRKTKGEEKELLEIQMSRMDRRRLKVRSTERVEGGLAIQFETKLTKESRKRSEESDQLNQDMYRYLGLLNWAMAKLRGEALVGNKYMDNPILVLKDAQEMQKEQESGRRGFITDAYTLERVSAGLIRFHPEQLSRKDLVWCKTIIDKKLSNMSLPINTLDGTTACIQVIPQMIVLFPEDKEKYAELLFKCLMMPAYGGADACDYAVAAIQSSDLWVKDAALIKDILERYIKDESLKTLHSYHLKVIFGLIPHSPDKETTDIAVKYLKVLPELIKSHEYEMQGMFDVVIYLVKLFMHTESTEILHCLPYTFPIIKESHLGSSYLTRFILEEEYCRKPDRFWLIWNTFREPIMESGTYCDNQELRTYTLNTEWKDGVKEWHSLRKKDVGFYTYLAEHSAGNAVVFEGLVKVLTTIASGYKTEGMAWIAKAINQCPTMNLNGTLSLMYLELVMMPYVYTNKMQIRKNLELLAQVRTILNFMVTKSSVTGYMLRDMVN